MHVFAWTPWNDIKEQIKGVIKRGANKKMEDRLEDGETYSLI